MQENNPKVSGKEIRKNMNQNMFSSEVEVGKFLVSIDVIQDAFQAISEISSTSSTYHLHTTRSGMKVLAFQSISESSSTYLEGELDLVLSDKHLLYFISPKVNPNFSVNKAVVKLFESHFDKLCELRNQLIHSPLVITGRGMGGCLAILFALLCQYEVDVQESNRSKTDKPAKRPICITFGSPLLGDKNLQGAVSERPQWISSFLNVIAQSDSLARIFSSDTPYKPFGTFLFCTKSGEHTAFEDQDAILAVLDTMVPPNAGNSQKHNYSTELNSIRKKVLYRGLSKVNEPSLNHLRAGIILQFGAMGMSNMHVMEEMEKKQAQMIRRSRHRYEPTRKLNDMKMDLTSMEWYMKKRKSKGGYYDVYKNVKNDTERLVDQEGIIKARLRMNQYWTKIVTESDLMPQKKDAKLRTRWLLTGQNYRMIIEPLDIADHYKSGKRNYMAVRPEHYKLLEKWSEEEKEDHKPSTGRKKAASLTEDSCFWAHVEEALISLGDLENGDLSSTATIEQFEAYLLGAINDFSLSPDVFLEGSSLMNWWKKYSAHRESLCNSELAQKMMNIVTYK